MSEVTAWRLRYELAPTDPRYLEAEYADILHDLLVLHFHRKIRTPRETNAIEELAESADKVADMVDRAEKFLSDEGTQKAFARMVKGGTPEELAQRSKPRSITIGGTAVMGARKP